MFSAIASRTKTKRIQPFILASLVLLGACEKTPPQAKTPDETPPSSTPSSSTPDESTPPNGAATAAVAASAAHVGAPPAQAGRPSSR